MIPGMKIEVLEDRNNGDYLRGFYDGIREAGKLMEKAGTPLILPAIGQEAGKK